MSERRHTLSPQDGAAEGTEAVRYFNSLQIEASEELQTRQGKNTPDATKKVLILKSKTNFVLR